LYPKITLGFTFSYDLDAFSSLLRVILDADSCLVWCLGSSIIRNAFMAARGSYRGTNLGLDAQNMKLWWQGYSGITLLNLRRKLKVLFKVGDEPTFVLIHCGGNDIGLSSLHVLRYCVDNILHDIHRHWPFAKVIWSEILPRRVWRYSNNAVAMDRVRQRLNNYAATKVCRAGGSYIKHADLRSVDNQLFGSDGIHLTALGNDIFLNELSAQLEAIKKRHEIH